MLTHNALPPAQAEALYETLPDPATPLAAPLRAGGASAWPGEDWLDDDVPSAFVRRAPSVSPTLPHSKPHRR